MAGTRTSYNREGEVYQEGRFIVYWMLGMWWLVVRKKKEERKGDEDGTIKSISDPHMGHSSS
jgi:hypothetical protein